MARRNNGGESQGQAQDQGQEKEERRQAAEETYRAQNGGRPPVFEVHCPNCGWRAADAANGSFLHLRCKNSGCKVYFSGYMVDGVFMCIEGRGRSKPIMQVAPPTVVG